MPPQPTTMGVGQSGHGSAALLSATLLLFCLFQHFWESLSRLKDVGRRKRQSTDESVKTVEDEMGDLPEADIKVILLGDSAVGKSK